MAKPIVEVVFWDHIQGDHRPLKCRVYGRLLKRTPKRLVVRSWKAEGRCNCTDFAIVTPAVIAVYVLTRSE